jgi:hypothetical protein
VQTLYTSDPPARTRPAAARGAALERSELRDVVARRSSTAHPASAQRAEAGAGRVEQHAVEHGRGNGGASPSEQTTATRAPSFSTFPRTRPARAGATSFATTRAPVAASRRRLPARRRAHVEHVLAALAPDRAATHCDARSCV